MRSKLRPANNGESTSVLNGTGLKLVVAPATDAVSSAVPSFQPAGNFTLAANMTCREKYPAG